MKNKTTELSVLTKIQLLFLSNYFMDCYNILANFNNSEKVNFNKFCWVLIYLGEGKKFRSSYFSFSLISLLIN